MRIGIPLSRQESYFLLKVKKTGMRRGFYYYAIKPFSAELKMPMPIEHLFCKR